MESRHLQNSDVSWDHDPGRDGALRRLRRVQRRNGSARYCAGGDIAARCPYQSTVHGATEGSFRRLEFEGYRDRTKGVGGLLPAKFVRQVVVRGRQFDALED